MKTIALILALYITIICNAQVKPIVEVEGGYINRANAIFVSPYNTKIGDKLYKFPIYTNIILGATWKFLTFKTYTMNMFKNSGGIDFGTGQIDFTTNINATYKNFEFGYEHYCSHPIISDPTIQMSYFRSSYDKIYLKIKILN